jgi:hypothetical protein
MAELLRLHGQAGDAEKTVTDSTSGALVALPDR